MKRDLPTYVVRLKGALYFKRRGWKTTKGMVAHYAGTARQKARAAKAQKRIE